jgi:magnesium transporter
MEPTRSPRLQDNVTEVQQLLAKHRMLETVARRQETRRSALLEQMQHRQNLVELHKRLRQMHPADIAYILEILPVDDRQLVWHEVTPALAGQALTELSPSIRESLIETTSRGALSEMLRSLDADDLRYLAESLPEELVGEMAAFLDAQDRKWVEERDAYPDGSAARLMTQDVLALRDTQTVADSIASIRRAGAIPSYTDRLFVVDARKVLVGAVAITDLLLADPADRLTAVMQGDVRRFRPHDEGRDVAGAFERYDLMSAPIVDDREKLIGRVTADAVLDFMKATSENEVLALAGLRRAEDIFAPVWDSARNRWPWLAINLATAFIASRVIGAFEGTISRLVALAALMPIVASVGGNTGNQTVALVVRGLALDQITVASAGHLLRKELTVSILNGVLWGTLVGVFAMIVYGSVSLGLVMSGAVLLNLIVAALVGVAVPLVLHRLDRDPAQGSSVVLTFVTDSMGFLLFLGMATAFLL